MIPKENPHGRVAGKSGRDQKLKEDFTVRFWQPLPLQHLLPFIGTFEAAQLRLGIGWGFQPLRESPHSEPSEPCLGFDFPSLLLPPLILPLPHLCRRLCVCAYIHPIWLCSFSLSLSLFLSLLPLEVSVYLSIFSARLPSNVSAIKTETGAKLTAP